MSFANYAAQQLTEVAQRLAAAAAKEIEAAIERATSTLQPTIDALGAERTELAADAEAQRREQEQLRAELERVTAEHAELLAEHERLQAEHRQVRSEHAQLMAAQGELTDGRAAADRALQQTRNLLEAARAGHRSVLLHGLQAVLDQIVQSHSVEDVLSAVASGLAGDFSRVAVLTIRDNCLEPTHQYGFDASSGFGKVLIPLTVDSLFTQAATADEVRAMSPDEVTDAGGPPFGGSPISIVTAPIKVRGEVLAVVYADDSGDGTSDAPTIDDRTRLADLLRHCAVLRLERLTIELRTVAELRAYAKMLLDEVEYVYAADANSEKPDKDRQDRLQENLRCARQIYQQRVTVEGPAAATLLDEQIATLTEAKAGTPYGDDLAIVAARSDLGMRAAQAS